MNWAVTIRARALQRRLWSVMVVMLTSIVSLNRCLRQYHYDNLFAHIYTQNDWRATLLRDERQPLPGPERLPRSSPLGALPAQAARHDRQGAVARGLEGSGSTPTTRRARRPRRGRARRRARSPTRSATTGASSSGCSTSSRRPACRARATRPTAGGSRQDDAGGQGRSASSAPSPTSTRSSSRRSTPAERAAARAAPRARGVRRRSADPPRG